MKKVTEAVMKEARRQFARKGGLARNKSLSAERKREIALRAVQAREAKRKERTQ